MTVWERPQTKWQMDSEIDRLTDRTGVRCCNCGWHERWRGHLSNDCGCVEQEATPALLLSHSCGDLSTARKLIRSNSASWFSVASLKKCPAAFNNSSVLIQYSVHPPPLLYLRPLWARPCTLCFCCFEPLNYRCLSVDTHVYSKGAFKCNKCYCTKTRISLH